MDESLSMAPQSDARWSSPGPIALNSERIRARYGNCTVRVLDQHDGLRRTALYSEGADGNTCRTFAVVRFAAEIPAPLSSAHARIVAGDSIGVSLTDQGLPIVRRTLDVQTLELDAGAAALLRLMRIHDPTHVAVHIYRLELEVDEDRLPYATIAEAHHPGYLDESALRNEFQPDLQTASDTAARDDMLALVGSFEPPAQP